MIYAPMQVYPEDHEEFKVICREQGVHQVDGFKLAKEAWKRVLKGED